MIVVNIRFLPSINLFHTLLQDREVYHDMKRPETEVIQGIIETSRKI